MIVITIEVKADNDGKSTIIARGYNGEPSERTEIALQHVEVEAVAVARGLREYAVKVVV